MTTSIKSFLKVFLISSSIVTFAAACDSEEADTQKSEPEAKDAGEVNLYTSRQPFLLQPLLEAFTKETGIKVNVAYMKSGMVERLKAEGSNSPADAVLTTNISRLYLMVQEGLLQSVDSDTLKQNIPSSYRGPNNQWFGLSLRARVIYVDKNDVEPGAIKTYEDLTDPKWKGRICTRSGKHPYNVDLLASIIAHKGEQAAQEWARGLKENLARKPQGNDRAQVKAIKEGICDVAIGNSYYMGKMATNEEEPEQKVWAEAVRVVFPNSEDRGTHVNISGGAVTKSADNKAGAVKLLEFLSSDQAQEIYARQNFEYPVQPNIELHPLVKSWGNLNPDTIQLSEVAKHRPLASKIMDRVEYNQ